MFCKKCGKENDNDANFCIYCGNKLTMENMNTTIKEDKSNITSKDSGSKCILKFMIGMVTLFRYFFGFPIMLVGIAFLFKNASIGGLFFATMGFAITPMYASKLNGKKRLYVGLGAFLLALIFDPIAENNKIIQADNNKIIKAELNKDISVDNTKQAVADNVEKQDSAMLSNDKLPPLPKKIDVKIDDSNNKMNALYNPKVLDIIPTQKGKGWDKVLNQYGVKGVNKINELLPQAAEIMSKSAECDTLAYVAHSSRGTPQNIVIFGHCNNGARFYLSETDIKNKVSVVSNKAKFEQMQHQLEDACNEIIKSRLNHPQTFDKSFVNSNTYIGVNNIKITVGFTAKNSFNMKLKHTAVCFFNEKPELVEFTITEDK